MKSKGEVVFLAAIFLGSLYFLIETFSFQVPGIGGRLGPGFWPQMILIALLILSGTLIAGHFLRRLPEAKGQQKSGPANYKYLLALALMIGYFLSLPVLGFILTTPIFMAVFMVLLGEKLWGWIIGVSLGLTVIVVILFTKAMYVPLPRGKGIFLHFSQLFY